MVGSRADHSLTGKTQEVGGQQVEEERLIPDPAAVVGDQQVGDLDEERQRRAVQIVAGAGDRVRVADEMRLVTADVDGRAIQPEV